MNLLDHSNPSICYTAVSKSTDLQIKCIFQNFTANESEEAATLAAREERTFDSEVEVSADRDSLAATDVARALLGNSLYQTGQRRSVLKSALIAIHWQPLC